jgi:aminomethyltransferase
MADFGGWEMPIEYPGGGVIAEHTSVRERVGLFDVSHLGKGWVRGSDARGFLNACLTNDLGKIGSGHAQYTLCCDESGGVVDDLIAYMHGDDAVFLVPNAANTAEVMRRIAAAAPPGISVDNVHRDYGVLAVQGPKSADVVDAIGLPTDLDYMEYAAAQWQGGEVFVCRTGYTGERGYELVPPSALAPQLWDALAESVAAYDGLPCGLGARDTLRTEMGYPLHGHELSLEMTPVQARAGWAVGWQKPKFWGRDALLREKETGPARFLRGLLAQDRAIPRAGMPVSSKDGEQVGAVTSGTFSPTLRTGIGLALLA